MKVCTLAYALLLSVLLCACREEQARIPEGTYVSVSGAETIEVGKSDIRFRIMIDERGIGSIVDRTYQYEVLPNGRLQPYPMASTEVLTGVGRFDWHWDGEQITQLDARKGGANAKIYRRPVSP